MIRPLLLFSFIFLSGTPSFSYSNFQNNLVIDSVSLRNASNLESQSLQNYKLGNINEAIQLLKESNRIRGIARETENVARNYLTIATYYHQMGNNESALIYLKLHYLESGNLKEQLFNNKINELERLNGLEVKALEEQRDKAENQNKQLSDLVAQQRIKISNWQTFTIALSLITLIVGTILLIFLFRKKPLEKAKVVAEANTPESLDLLEKEIALLNFNNSETKKLGKIILGDSNSMEKGLKKIVPDLVLLDRPKDTVGGDFFWYHHENSILILVVGDCNSEGLRGAMVSSFLKNILKHTVSEEKIFTPGMVLTLIDQQVRQKISADEDNPVLGISLSYLLIHMNTGQVEFAGAASSIFYSEKGKINIQKGNILPLGNSFGQEKFFNTHTFNSLKGEMIYVVTNGYTDQVGYKEERRFQRETLRKLLETTQTKKASEQYYMLDKVHNEWKGLKPQTDDILAIGLRI